MLDNDPPTPIVGASLICVGSTITFTDAVGGGLWSSQLPIIASANGVTGDIFGSTPGADSIVYTILACPPATFPVTVNPAPTPIAGPDMVCVGSSISLSDATTGGFWSSGNPGFATVDTNGNVFGQNGGILSVDYTTGGCAPASITITVNPTPTAIAGLTQVCATFTTTLTDGVSGGIWTSSTPAVASIDPLSGIVLGVDAGVAMITYTLPAGCSKSLLFTVNPLPAPITFPTAIVCVGSVITFSNDSTGGMWSSGSTAVATVGTGDGLISGVGAGITNIIYTLPTGCLAFAPVTVNPLPNPSAGPSIVCADGTITLINSSPGGPGTWSSGNNSLATVGLVSGVVTGVSVGTVNIIYSLPTGCNTSSLVTVDPVPAAIFGFSSVCVGSSITLTDITPGGTWNTGSAAASVVPGTGVVNGLSAGIANISYTITATGCSATSAVTVNPLPSAISGPTTICQNAIIILGDTDPGGSWSSTNTTIASIGLTSGIVTGLAPGTATIIYAFPTSCSTGITITTQATPVAVITPGGPTTFCIGGDVVLAATGGVYTYQWYDSGVAIFGAIGATYTALTTGSYTVKVISSFGCSDSSAATGVSNGIFPVLDYTGSSSICVGKNLLLTADPGAAVGFITYEWEDNGIVIPGASDVTFDATAAGSYNSVVTILGASGACTVNSDTVTIAVNPLPVPVVSFDGTTLSTANTYTSYQWFLNTVGIPGANSNTYVPLINGSYRVLVVDANGCDGYSAATLVSTTGVKQITSADIKIYPNPATSIVHIEAPVSIRAVITSVEGKTVLEQENAKDINIGGLANGLYLIMIYDETGNQVMIEKLIKE